MKRTAICLFLLLLTSCSAYRKGVEEYAAGDYAAAIGRFTKILQSNPGHARAHCMRGASRLAAGEDDLALADFDRAVELDSTNAWIRSWRGVYYLRKGMYPNAIEDYTTGIRVDSSYWENYTGRARAFLFTNQKALADSDLSRSLLVRRHVFSAYYAVAEAYGNNGYYDDAIRVYLAYLVRDSTEAYCHGNLGWTYYLKGEFNKCIDQSIIALRFNPRLYYVKYNMALTYLRLGNMLKATEYYQNTLKEAGKDSDATQGAVRDLIALVNNDIKAREAYIVLTEIFELRPP